jgi:hypothetical protein
LAEVQKKQKEREVYNLISGGGMSPTTAAIKAAFTNRSTHSNNSLKNVYVNKSLGRNHDL